MANSKKSGKSTGIAIASENSIAAFTVAQARTRALQVLEVGLRNDSSEAKPWALCDTGSIHSWVSEKLRSEMGLKGSPEVVFVRVVTGTIEGSTRCVVLERFLLEDNNYVPLKFFALVRTDLFWGNEKLGLQSIKDECWPVEHVADLIENSKLPVILGQDMFSTICPIGYSTSDKHLPWAVQLPIGWVVSGPLPDCKQLKVSCCMLSSTETNSDKSNGCAENLSSQVSKWWALESYSFLSRYRRDLKVTNRL